MAPIDGGGRDCGSHRHVGVAWRTSRLGQARLGLALEEQLAAWGAVELRVGWFRVPNPAGTD